MSTPASENHFAWAIQPAPRTKLASRSNFACGSGLLTATKLAFLFVFLSLPALAQNIPAQPKEAPGPMMKEALAGKHLWATLETKEGTLVAELFSKRAPNTVANFVGLATGEKSWFDPVPGKWVHHPLYDGTLFHRTMLHFMIQGGDPIGTGFGGPGFSIPDEFKGAKFTRPGLLAMANTGRPNSAGSQFFITVSTPHWLDGKYSIFGRVISGYDVAVRISQRPVRGDRPYDPVKLEKVTITDHKPRIHTKPQAKKATGHAAKAPAKKEK